MHTRPCFLVVDDEHASSISTRKLVLETAKYNVITAYSCQEADAVIRRFPNVNAVVINGGTQDRSAGPFMETLSEMPEVKLVVVGDGPLNSGTRLPDAAVENFAPQILLSALQTLFPGASRELLEHEEQLERKGI
ncbi:MAG: response regulator [Terriglobus roseus]|nr:response regulator [Terriglobus roseus]